MYSIAVLTSSISQFFLIILSPIIIKYLFKPTNFKVLVQGLCCSGLSFAIYIVIYLMYVFIGKMANIDYQIINFSNFNLKVVHSTITILFLIFIMIILFYLTMFFNLFIFIKKLEKKSNNINDFFMFLSGYFILYSIIYIGIIIIAIWNKIDFQISFTLLILILFLYAHQFGIIGRGILLYLYQKKKSKEIKVINICNFFVFLLLIISGFLFDYLLEIFAFLYAIFDFVTFFIGINYIDKYSYDNEILAAQLNEISENNY